MLQGCIRCDVRSCIWIKITYYCQCHILIRVFPVVNIVIQSTYEATIFGIIEVHFKTIPQYVFSPLPNRLDQLESFLPKEGSLLYACPEYI